MIRFILVAILYLFAAGCSDGSDGSRTDGSGGSPSKPAAKPCPFSQSALESPCSQPGQVCEFIEVGRLTRCSCSSSGAQQCGVVG